MEEHDIGSRWATDAAGAAVDDNLALFFQPDTLLSAQYFENFRPKTLLAPEKKLMLAVLEDALYCYQRNLFARDLRHRKLFDDAEHWIFETDGDWLFSFEHVCEILGLDPSFVRRNLLAWKLRENQQYLKNDRPGKQRRGGRTQTRRSIHEFMGIDFSSKPRQQRAL